MIRTQRQEVIFNLIPYLPPFNVFCIKLWHTIFFSFSPLVAETSLSRPLSKFTHANIIHFSFYKNFKCHFNQIFNQDFKCHFNQILLIFVTYNFHKFLYLMNMSENNKHFHRIWMFIIEEPNTRRILVKEFLLFMVPM